MSSKKDLHFSQIIAIIGNMSDIELFWERVNSLIKQHNTTQSAISVQCGMNPRRLQNLSGGNRLPDCFEAVLIAKALNTTVEYLVTGNSTGSDKELSELKRQILEFAKSVQ